MVWKRQARRNAPNIVASQHVVFFRHSRRTKRVGQLAAGHYLQRGPGRGKRTERMPVSAREAHATARADAPPQPLPDVCPGPAGPAELGGCTAHCSPTPSHLAALEPLLLPTPRCERVLVVGGAAAALGHPAEAGLGSSAQAHSPGAAVPLAIPSLPADATARAPTAPSPPRSGYRLMKCSFSSVICFVFLQSSDK